MAKAQCEVCAAVEPIDGFRAFVFRVWCTVIHGRVYTDDDEADGGDAVTGSAGGSGEGEAGQVEVDNDASAACTVNLSFLTRVRRQMSDSYRGIEGTVVGSSNEVQKTEVVFEKDRCICPVCIFV